MKKYKLVFIMLILPISIFAQPKRIFIANDNHTDYMWSADEETYKNAFIKMLDYYMNLNDSTSRLMPEYQNKWNCDGTFWLWTYELNKTLSEFQRLIDQVKAGRITVPYNALISCYGGMPAEAMLRGMYYAGSLERRFDMKLSIASAMEDQVLPYGLSSLWAGIGVKYAWHGVCGCVTRTPGITKRVNEIYWYTGPDDQKVLMKWYSLKNNNNMSLGGYAEARDPENAVEQCDSICNTTNYPYAIAAAFGQGWDDMSTFCNSFPSVAENKTNLSRQIIVSNEIDFFKEFEAKYGNDLPSESVSHGNEWDTYCASMAEVSARVKRAVEKLRCAEAMSSIVSLQDSTFASELTSLKNQAWIALGLYWEHGWTGDSPNISRLVRASFQRKTEHQITVYVDSLYNISKRKISSLLKTGGSDKHFFVFNPLSWERTDVAEVEWPYSSIVHVFDVITGKEVPNQQITKNKVNYLRILAPNVPSIGYKIFEIREGKSSLTGKAVTVLNNTLENRFFKITLTKQGVITSIIDKKNGNRECVANIGGKFVNDLGSGRSDIGELTVENEGPVSATIVAKGNLPLKHTSRITLYNDISRIDIQNSITQNFSDLYTWAFSFNLTQPSIYHEELGAVIKARLISQGGQYATSNARYDWLTLQHFADISESNFGISLSNADCYFMKTGNSKIDYLDSAASQISVLIGGQTDGIELGIQNQGGDSLFMQRFALGTHQYFSAVNSMKFSMEHQNPFCAGIISGTTSVLDDNLYSLLSGSSPDVLVWSVKPSEEGITNGLIVRLWNLSSFPVTETIRFNRNISAAWHTSHVETNIEPATIKENELTINLRKNEIKTFRVKLDFSANIFHN